MSFEFRGSDMPINEAIPGSEGQPNLFDSPFPGSLNFDSSVRAIVADVFKRIEKSRAQVADEMSFLLAMKVTEQMLNDFTAESKAGHRFPALFIPAFCQSTGDFRLLHMLTRPLGLRVIDQRQSQLLGLAEALETKHRADVAFEAAKLRAFGGAQ